MCFIVVPKCEGLQPFLLGSPTPKDKEEAEEDGDVYVRLYDCRRVGDFWSLISSPDFCFAS